MPKGSKYKVVSEAQARLFGAVAGGLKTKATGLSQAEAKKDLKGIKVKPLPEKSKKGKKK